MAFLLIIVFPIAFVSGVWLGLALDARRTRKDFEKQCREVRELYGHPTASGGLSRNAESPPPVR
jgi:hypothetical protein